MPSNPTTKAPATKRGFRYSLEKGSKKHICPDCKEKRFVRYVDNETGQYLPPEYGRCDREIECKYKRNPYEDGYAKAQRENSQPAKKRKKSILQAPAPPVVPPSLTKPETVNATLKGYDDGNNFVAFLTAQFGTEITSDLIKRYYIGTSKHWKGATVFWYITQNGDVRGGKIMLYFADSSKRVKKPFNHITWVHAVLKESDYNLELCFFGEHLLSLHPTAPVCIVESEKTAIIASVYFPDVVWLSCGGIKNLSVEKAKALGKRKVILIPDVGAFETWHQTAKELNIYLPATHFILTDLLERNAIDSEKGYDLADYLLEGAERWLVPVNELFFPAPKVLPTVKMVMTDEPIPVATTPVSTPCIELETNIPKSVEREISNEKKSEGDVNPKNYYPEAVIFDLEHYFSAFDLAGKRIRLSNFETITDGKAFVESQLSGLKNTNGTRHVHSFMERLKRFQTLLSTQQNA